MSHRRHERLSDKLPRPSCPTCGSDDPAWVRLSYGTMSGGQRASSGLCPDPFHQSDTETEEEPEYRNWPSDGDLT